MRFWDASAVVPLLVEENERPRILALLETDPEMVVWWGTQVECASALARRPREGLLAKADCSEAIARLEALARAWYEVQPSESVRTTAMRLLAVHPLRAADALQLAAALAACEGDPARMEFVCLDRQLVRTARREGFSVLPG